MNQQSPFSAVMIGPEGSGKTVLAAVLADYVIKTSNVGLEIRAANIDTKSYFERVMSTLRHGKWPPTTRPGEPQVLDWEWRTAKLASESPDSWCQAQLVDLAGQDIRTELAGKSSKHGITQRIMDADLVILVIDIVDHQSVHDLQKQQNAWIIERVLRLIERDINHKSLILAVTKADRLTHAIPEGMGRVKEAVLAAIEQCMPECNLKAYRSTLHSPRCGVVAVAAVTAQSDYHEDQPSLVPTNQQIGMADFVQELVAAIDRMHDDKAAAARRAHQLALVKAVAPWAVAVVALFFVGPPVWKAIKARLERPSEVVLVTTCDECRGDGVKGLPGFKKKCKPCKGSGKIWTTVPSSP